MEFSSWILLATSIIVFKAILYLALDLPMDGPYVSY
jgi:hypothetical protein